MWARDEVKRIIGDSPDYDAFFQIYGLKREPNFEKDRYVLLEPRTRAEQAPTLNATPETLEARLAPLRARMLAAREKRPAPLRDDKVLTSWNGLMIAAYADGFRILHDARYRAAAEKAADFLLNMMRTPDGRLLRTYRDGRAKLPAYLEDYAFLAHGLIRLHLATGDPKRLEQARELTDRMISDFADRKLGGFFFTADSHESLIARTKDPLDNVLPSGNSIAIRNLVALATLTHESRYLDLAGQTLDAFSDHLGRSPMTLPMMLVGLGEYLDARPAPPVTLPGAERGRNEVVEIEAESPQPAEVAAGGDFSVALVLTIQRGWHAYANPPGAENLLPTRVSIAPSEDASLVTVDYPPGEKKVLESSGKDKVAVYEGKARLIAHIRINGDTKPGKRVVKINVHYQACDDKQCLAPAKRVVEVPVTVK